MNQETANYIMQRMSKYLDNSQMIKLKDTLDESLRQLRRIHTALKSALIDQPKAPKHQNTDKHGALDDAIVLKIIEILKEKPDISQEALGENMGVTRRVVQKYINVLKEAGRIERVGGKRYGHWKIND